MRKFISQPGCMIGEKETIELGAMEVGMPKTTHEVTLTRTLTGLRTPTGLKSTPESTWAKAASSG
jgi:hypothetical protein